MAPVGSYGPAKLIEVFPTLSLFQCNVNGPTLKCQNRKSGSGFSHVNRVKMSEISTCEIILKLSVGRTVSLAGAL